MCSESGKRLRVATIALVLLVANAACRADDKPKEQPKDPVSQEVYEPGPTVKAPKLIHYVEPEFSASSKEAFVEGVVKVSTVVSTEGIVANCQVVRGLNAEEDKTAIKAVKLWRFQPGTKDGRPVNVRVTVEIEFHLM